MTERGPSVHGLVRGDFVPLPGAGSRGNEKNETVTLTGLLPAAVHGYMGGVDNS